MVLSVFDDVDDSFFRVHTLAQQDDSLHRVSKSLGYRKQFLDLFPENMNSSPRRSITMYQQHEGSSTRHWCQFIS
jgi:hypothetical protein